MSDKNQWYIIKYIQKKNKIRRIVTYNNESMRLKHLKIKEYLEANLLFSKFTKAYIKDSSIFKNAKAHMYNDIFIKLDIKDFFNSINHLILLEVLYYELNKKHIDKVVTKIEISKLINLCSIHKKGIPLGLITSPTLSNIYLKEFDNILYGSLRKLDKQDIIYTRYADDLTISFKSKDKLSKEDLEIIISLVTKFLKKYKLKLNISKTNIIDLNISNHVRITGISIIKDQNNYRKISVGRKRINKLYHDTINMYSKIKNQNFILTEEDQYEIKKLKGMESFIYSIEKKGYNKIFSDDMKNYINILGYNSLSELITNLSTLQKDDLLK